MKPHLGLLLSVLLLSLPACDDKFFPKAKSTTAPAAESGAIQSEADLLDSDYLALVVNHAVARDLNMELATQIKLALISREYTQWFASAGTNMAGLAEKGAAIRTALGSDEDFHFRSWYVRNHFAHVQDVNGRPEIPPYTSPGGWHNQAAWSDEALAAPCPFEDQNLWRSSDIDRWLMKNPHDAVSVYTKARDPDVVNAALSWLTYAKAAPKYHDEVMDVLRQHFIPWRITREADFSALSRRLELERMLCATALRWAQPKDLNVILAITDGAIDPAIDPNRSDFQKERLAAWTALGRMAPETARKRLADRAEIEGNYCDDLGREWRRINDEKLISLSNDMAKDRAVFDRAAMEKRVGHHIETPDELVVTPENVLHWLESDRKEVLDRGFENISKVKFTPEQRPRIAHALAVALERPDMRFNQSQILADLMAIGTVSEIPNIARAADTDTQGTDLMVRAMTTALAIDAQAGRAAIESRATNKNMIERLESCIRQLDPAATARAGVLIGSSVPEVRKVGRQLMETCGDETQAAALRTAAAGVKDLSEKRDLETLVKKVALRPAGSIHTGPPPKLPPAMPVNPVETLRLAPPKDVEQAVSWLEKGTGSQRLAAIVALRTLTVPATLRGNIHKFLVATIEDSDGIVRIEGVRNLIIFGQPEDFGGLATLSKDRDPNLALVAIVASIKVNPTRAQPSLEQTDARSLNRIFTELIAAGPVVEDAVYPMLKSRNAALREAAIDTMAEIGTGKYIGGMGAVAGTEPVPELKTKLQDAIARIQARAKATTAPAPK